jgi:glucose-1-phosphate cytidylyltransferase
MKVVILCGGKGTRLREETEYRPKPMVPIGNRPILWHIMRTYATQGHTEFILCLGHKGEVIKDWFKSLHWATSDITMTIGDLQSTQFHSEMVEKGWKVTLADTGEETMTGGRIKRIQKFLGDAPEFLMTYGDGVGNIDINKAIKQHRESGKILTLTGVRPPGRWGEIQVEGGKVTSFSEKPQTSVGRINGGYFVANHQVFNYLNEDPSLIFEQSPLNKLAEDGKLGCFEHDGFWQPMDTYQEFLLLNKLWNEGRAEWKLW